MSSYFYLQKGKVVGPISERDVIHRIEEHTIGGFDLLYRNDEKKWKSVLEFPEFQNFYKEETVIEREVEEEISGIHSQIGKKNLAARESSQQWVVLKILDRKARPLKTKQLGPFSASTVQKMLKRGQLSFHDYVWTDGMDQWGVLVEQERLVPAKDNPKTIESIAIEDSVVLPMQSNNDLLSQVISVKRGEVYQEAIPEDADPIDLIEARGGDFEERSNTRETSVSVSVQDDSEKEAEISHAAETVAKSKGQVQKNLGLQKSSPEPVAQKRQRVLTGSSTAGLRFRFLQILFVCFLLGGVVGVVLFFAHPPELSNFVDASHTEPDVSHHASAKISTTKTAKAQVSVKQSKPSQQQSVPVSEQRRAPSYVRLKLVGAQSPQPEVFIDTDATRHFAVSITLSGAAGQILGHPSFHRQWRRGELSSKSRKIRLRTYEIGDGWYTLSVVVDGKKAVKTFFVGDKKSFKADIRQYRKNISYANQREKEQLHFLLRDISQALVVWKAQSFSVPGRKAVLNRLKAAERQVLRVVRNKNAHLWTPIWMEVKDLVIANKEFAAGVTARQSPDEKKWMKLQGQINKVRSKVQTLSLEV